MVGSFCKALTLRPQCGLWLMTEMFSKSQVNLSLGLSHIQNCCFLVQHGRIGNKSYYSYDGYSIPGSIRIQTHRPIVSQLLLRLLYVMARKK